MEGRQRPAASLPLWSLDGAPEGSPTATGSALVPPVEEVTTAWGWWCWHHTQTPGMEPEAGKLCTYFEEQRRMEREFLAWFWVSVFLETNGFCLCKIDLDSGSFLFPQIVQHLNKDVVPSPPVFGLRICLCLMTDSRTPFLFSNNFFINFQECNIEYKQHFQTYLNM